MKYYYQFENQNHQFLSKFNIFFNNILKNEYNSIQYNTSILRFFLKSYTFCLQKYYTLFKPCSKQSNKKLFKILSPSQNPLQSLPLSSPPTFLKVVNTSRKTGRNNFAKRQQKVKKIPCKFVEQRRFPSNQIAGLAFEPNAAANKTQGFTIPLVPREKGIDSGGSKIRIFIFTFGPFNIGAIRITRGKNRGGKQRG